jgi:hypothetical protein
MFYRTKLLHFTLVPTVHRGNAQGHKLREAPSNDSLAVLGRTIRSWGLLDPVYGQGVALELRDVE